MARRKSPVEWNFDGLTDSITNLAGSLVLLVVLVFAVTKPRQAGLEEPSLPEKTVGAETPIEDLVHQIHSLRTEVEEVNGQTEQIEARLPAIAADVEALEKRGKQSD